MCGPSFFLCLLNRPFLSKILSALPSTLFATRYSVCNKQWYMNQLKIMMIDDNAIDHLIVQRICEKENLLGHIKHFYHPVEPLALLKTIGNNIAQLPDIILLDLHMPGICGWEMLDYFAEIQRMAGKHIDVHVLSDSLDYADKARSQTYAFVRNFFVKPLTSFVLRQLHQYYLQLNIAPL